MTAIYHLDLQTLSRRQDRSMVQMAAYLTGQRLLNWETGKINARRSTEDVCAWECHALGITIADLEVVRLGN